jgi:hypothetical protein
MTVNSADVRDCDSGSSRPRCYFLPVRSGQVAALGWIGSVPIERNRVVTVSRARVIHALLLNAQIQARNSASRERDSMYLRVPVSVRRFKYLTTGSRLSGERKNQAGGPPRPGTQRYVDKRKSAFRGTGRASNVRAKGWATGRIWPDLDLTGSDRFQLFLDVFATNGVGMC